MVHSARDCYRLGAAFEPFSGLTIDDVQLTGLFGLGQKAVLLVVQGALANPTLPLVELLRHIFWPSAVSMIRTEEVRTRWIWLEKLY